MLSGRAGVWYQMIKQLWKRKKQGFFTPFMAMFIYFMLPIMFVMADVGLRIYIAEDLRMTLDNAVLTAVGQVKYDSTGHIWVDEVAAREEVQSILGDALTDGGTVNDDGEIEDYNLDLFARRPTVSFHLVNPIQGDSASGTGSFEYTYWERDRNGTHVWNAEIEQFVVSNDGTHKKVTETYDYANVQNPTLYIHVDLEYKSPIMRFMTPQTFQRVSGAEVFISNNSTNPD